MFKLNFWKNCYLISKNNIESFTEAAFELLYTVFARCLTPNRVIGHSIPWTNFISHESKNYNSYSAGVDFATISDFDLQQKKTKCQIEIIFFIL